MEYFKPKKINVKPLCDDRIHEQHRHTQQRLQSGCTNLMYACQQGLTDSVVSELRNRPSVVHRRDRSNKSALHYCTGQKDLVAAASVAVAAPELLESADEDGFTPLHLAVIQGNISLVNLLLANKADVNALDNEGHSVVHWATVCGEVEALRAVLQAGANVSNPDINGGSPLHYAAQMCGANYEGKSNQASSKLALEILEILLAHQGSSVDVIDKDGRQPLLWAASAGSAKAILALVKAGARVESSDKDGLTALHCAASRGHTECLDTLINLCGAQTDLIDSNGCTALHYAVTLGHADATSLLLKLDADPNRQDRKGRTPAHCGCAKGQLETVKILGSKNANLWLRNAKGDLPVHEAAASGRKELVLWLLEQRPNQINVSSNDGRTLLHLAASNENTDLCKMLLDLGADVNSIARISHNVIQTPLDCALQKGHRSVAKYLQSIGGLPASKIRLSARRQINTTEPVKPLKFAEKEELVDIKTNAKRYVVYVKKSDSDESLCNATDHASRSRHAHYKCRHHHRRTASSCSDSYKPKFDEFDDDEDEMNRSKSSMEISRRTKYRHKYASSSTSSSDECDCGLRSSNKVHRHQKIKRSKSYDKHHYYGDRNTGKKYHKPKHTITKYHHRHRRSRSASSDHSDTGGLNDFEKIKAKFEAYKKKLEILEEHKKSLVLVRSEPLVEKSKESVEIKPEPVQVEAVAESSVDKVDEIEKSKPPSRPASGKKRPQSARASSANRRKLLQSQDTRDNIPESEIMGPESIDLKAELKDIQELSDGTNDNEINKVVTEAQIHVNAEQLQLEQEKLQESVNKEELELQATENLIADSTVESNVQPDLSSPSIVPTEPSIEQTTKPTSFEIVPEAETSLVQLETSVTHDETTDNGDQTVEPSFAVVPCDTTEPIPNDLGDLPSFTLIESDTQIDDLPAVTPLPDEMEEEITKTSFQVIDEPNRENAIEIESEYITDSTDKEKSQENLVTKDDRIEAETEEADETEDTTIIENVPATSFTIIEEDIDAVTSQKLQFIDNNANVIDDKMMTAQIGDSVGLNGDRMVVGGGSGMSRRKKLKKRIKSKTHSTISDDELDGTMEPETSVQQISKDQDSGFEPSPRATRPSTKRLAFTTLDDADYSAITPTNRAVGRKPGDRYAVNMVTVQQSIQRNIRRYYMERKIFQHLLELKSLQIRSSKTNESILVKRAVDDYHKSIISLGYEHGSTLKRYPYQDYTFKNFETFLYETLKNLQKNGTYNFQNISEVYKEAERRLSPEYTSRYERALNCTTKTHRCLHAVHAYTGIPCAAYIPMMNHHTIPKFGFGPYKTTGVGSFYLPKILTRNPKIGNKVSLELSHGNQKQLIPLPYDKLDKNKKYYVTFSVKGNGNLNTYETDKTASASDCENK